ncbi:MAG: hypothetical protein RID23_19490 [Roseovarius sp.]
MALNPRLREILDIGEASTTREARATFKKFMNRPKMLNKLGFLAGEIYPLYGLEYGVPDFVTSDDALPEAGELAHQLESYGRMLRDYVRAFEWLNYKGLDTIRKKSNPIKLTHHDGKEYEGHWFIETGAHGTGQNIVYVFYGDDFDIGFVGKRRSERGIELHVEEALSDLIDENNQEEVA